MMMFILVDEVGQAFSKMRCLSLGLKDERAFEGRRIFWVETTRHSWVIETVSNSYPRSLPWCRWLGESAEEDQNPRSSFWARKSCVHL